MAINISDYLIDPSTVKWSTALSEWLWLLPTELTVWLVNRFGEPVLVLEDGTVHHLDVGSGTLTNIADSREHFLSIVDENATDWFMIPLVDEMVAAGITLQPGECYGFKILPVLGGKYDVENVAPIPIPDYLGAWGSVHRQIKDLPDGAKVRLKVVP